MTQQFQMTRGMYLGTQLLKKLMQVGLPLGPLVLLSHRGRKSGKLYETPVALVKRNEATWLVSPFGEVNWVLNVRSNGEARIHNKRVELTEIESPDTTAPILKQFLTQFGIVPFIPPYFQATSKSPLDDFKQEAPLHPVFRIETLGSQS